MWINYITYLIPKHYISIPHSFVATTGLSTISTSFPSTVDKLSSLAAMDKPPPIFYVEVLIGGTAQLPCKIINPQGTIELCIMNNKQMHLDRLHYIILCNYRFSFFLIQITTKCTWFYGSRTTPRNPFIAWMLEAGPRVKVKE